jgi:hypothetical protein
VTAVPDSNKALRGGALLLAAAGALNIKVGSDGTSVITVSTTKVPLAGDLLDRVRTRQKQARRDQPHFARKRGVSRRQIK